MITSYNVVFVEHENQFTAKSDYYIYDIDKKDFSVTFWSGPDELFLSSADNLDYAKAIVRAHIELINLDKATESKYNRLLRKHLNKHRKTFENIIDQYRRKI